MWFDGVNHGYYSGKSIQEFCLFVLFGENSTVDIIRHCNIYEVFGLFGGINFTEGHFSFRACV